MSWRFSEVMIKLAVIIISAIYPFVMISLEGRLFSISQYWNTELQPLFIVANVMTASFFFSLPLWKWPAYFLVLLTAFSVQLYPQTHDILASLFFISCLWPLLKLKRWRYFIPLYLLSIPIGVFFGILQLELWAIITLCAYHTQSLIWTLILMSRKEKIEKEILS